MLDIRTPIGAMFLILGGLIGIYGMVTPAETYRISLGYNVNLLWGAVMAIFGFAMLAWRLVEQNRRHVPEAAIEAAVPEIQALPR